MIELHADVLFTYDTRGRMLTTNEPLASSRRPAPRAFVVRDDDRRIVRIGAGVPDELLIASDVEITSALGSTPEHGVCYRFPDAIAASSAVAITRANRELACDTFPWLVAEIDDWQPCFGVVVAGAIVAAHRGRGHACEVTRAWGAAIRASGRVPLYSTSADNLASQGVARRCELIPYGTTTTWA